MSNRRVGRNRGRVSASGITIPSPRLRYNFDAANITKSGSAISQVNDLSGNAEHLTQVTGTRQPTWVDNTDPSTTQDIMRCVPDGANYKAVSKSTSTVFTAVSGYTVFLAFNRVETTTGNWDHFAHNKQASIAGGWALRSSNGANGRQFQARTSGGTLKYVTFGTVTANTPEIWCVKNWGGGSDDVDSTSWFKSRVNGTEVAWAVGSGSPWFWVPTSGVVTQIGSTTATAVNQCDYFECRAYDAYLSDAQCLAVERALGSKYGITVA